MHKQVGGRGEAGVRAFIATIGDSPCPSADEIQSAMNAGRRKIVEVIFSRDVVLIIGGGDMPDEHRLNSIKQEFSLFEPPLDAPPLPAVTEMMGSRIAFAAALGAILGTLIGSPICIYLLAMRDVGLLLGPPIGAFLTTLGWSGRRGTCGFLGCSPRRWASLRSPRYGRC